MIKVLLQFLQQQSVYMSDLPLWEYITFRFLMAMITALMINLLFGHRLIYLLHRMNFKDSSGEFQALSVYSKRGTPTAGGIIIILATVLSAGLWSDLGNPFAIALLIGFCYLGLVGFIDDFQKSRFQSSLSGLSQAGKTVLLLMFIVPFALYFVSKHSPVPEEIRTAVFLPFMKNALFDPGPAVFFCFIVLTLFAIINAVNITDGMDGLLGGLSIITIGVYAIFAYIIGSAGLAEYFLFPPIEGNTEITVFSGALIGAIFGFLWYNFYPAEVFMGDTGSLAIGGVIGMTCFFTKQEFLFMIVGGIFVLEIFTSLLNDKVANMSRFGRRIVHRAPFHYTIIHRGVAEPKAVFRLITAGIALALVALLSIKVR